MSRTAHLLSSMAMVLGALVAVTTLSGSTPSVASAAEAAQASSTPAGYWMAASDGGVFAKGNAPFEGSLGGRRMHTPIVGMAVTPSSTGYWLVASDGGVFSFGDATFHGSLGDRRLHAPIVGMAASPTGNGYWLVASDGGVFSFGDATFHGSLAERRLQASIVGMSASPTGNGYWLVASDGGVFNFGDATFYGSVGGMGLNRPIVGISGTPSGDGYRLVSSDGGIFDFGSATFEGSLSGQPLLAPIVGMAATADGNGYWLVAADGRVFNFGTAPFSGSLGSVKQSRPIVAIATVGPAIGGRALLVGTFDGIPGQYRSIQAAVNAARPGDWILVAPGDYHEQADHLNPPSAADVSRGWYGGVEIHTNDIHLRGMNRSSVVVDGTRPGASQCSSNAADQDLGASSSNAPLGRNGIDIWANGVSVQNLTVCNFQLVENSQGNQAGDGGNEIWWDGGDGTGKIGLQGYEGSYLTATDSFNGVVSGGSAFANYGIFSSGSQGPGVWNQTYANNFADSGMYIGACQQVCDAWVDHAWMENNALGYSGTNSGGTLVIEHSQFDNNMDGLDTNTQSAGDPPPPQNGACPDNGISGFTGTHSCWVFMDNYSHDNNNTQVPGAGLSGEPPGTGMTVSGATNDTIMDNTFANNDAWGTLIVPFPDGDPGPTGVCASSGGQLVAGTCIYDPKGDALLNNTYSGNGSYGNPTDGDFGQIAFFGGEPQNCYGGNAIPDGSTPSDLEQTQPPSSCGVTTTAANTGGALLTQVLCATGFAASFGVSCAGITYPKPSTPPIMTAARSNLPTMSDPCQGVPSNRWCAGARSVSP